MLDALQHMWIYMHHMTNSPRPQLPRGYGVPGPLGVTSDIPLPLLPPHQLDLMLRELIIHADLRHPGIRSLKQWNDLARLVNTVKDHANLAATARGEGHAFEVLHLLVHQQLPWQQLSLKRDMARMAILLKAPGVRPILEQAFGLTVEQYFFLAFSTLTLAEEHAVWRRFHDYREYGLALETVSAFYDRISDSIETQRENQLQYQEHTANWEYSWNPLQFKPLLSMSHPQGIHYFCPAPPHLHRRLFSGVFYDMVPVEGFSRAMGDAFDSLIGFVLQRGYPGLGAEKPAPYTGPNRAQHQGTDWIGSDGTATVFIECKTMRLTRDARILKDVAALERKIDEMAGAVVQNYRNIQEALDGHTAWTPNDLPIYNIVVTLEDWILFSPVTHQRLDERIRARLATGALDQLLPARIPYCVCCAHEIEELVFAWAESSVQAVMSEKHDGERDRWLLGAFLHNNYPGTHQRAHELLTPEADAIFEEITRIARRGSTEP